MDTLQNRKTKPPPSNRRVLVLGRERAAGEATERYLEHCGHQVSLAKDPGSAITEAERMRPQVLICDMNPDSGDERIRAARLIQERHAPAMVVITSHYCREIQDRFPELRVARCLTKPVSLRRLAQSVADTAPGSPREPRSDKMT